MSKQLLKENYELSTDELKEILEGYLETALWTEEEYLTGEYNSDDESDEDYDTDDEIEKMVHTKTPTTVRTFNIHEDFEDNSIVKAYLDIKKFIKMAGADAVMEAINENGYDTLGHDIWLSRNGHGAGFIDHFYDHEEVLKQAARDLGTIYIYRNNNDKLSFSNEHIYESVRKMIRRILNEEFESKKKVF